MRARDAARNLAGGKLAPVSSGQPVIAREEKPPRAPSARRLLAVVLSVLLVILLGTVPGEVPGALVIEWVAPPVPASMGARDASLDVWVRVGGQQGLAGVHVRAFTMIEGRAHHGGDAASDASGLARIGGLPRGEHWIVAERDGYARGSAMVVLAPGARRLDLALVPENHVEVTVRDETGRPASGAEIEVSARDPVPTGARADEAGRARVGRLGEGPFVVRVRAAALGLEDAVRRGVRAGESVEITLRRLGVLLVRVVDTADGRVVGARVMLSSPALAAPRSAETGADGSVRIAALEPGSYSLRATKGALVSPVEIALSVSASEEKEVTLHLAPGRFVAVRATDGDGEDAEAVSGARVVLAEGGVSSFPAEAVTDAKGKAVLGPISAGPASVSVSAQGFVPRGPIVASDPGETRVALTRAGVIEGRVLDARGFGIDGATLEVLGTDLHGGPIEEDPARIGFRESMFAARLAGPAPLVRVGELGVVPGPVAPIPAAHAAFSGAAGRGAPPADPWVSRRDGTFRLSPVSTGRIRVIVRHPQYTESASDTFTLDPGRTAHVDLVMRQGGAIEGRVEDPRGRAVQGARVTLVAHAGSLEKSAVSAQDGSFAFAAVPEVVTILVSYPEDPLEHALRVEAKVAEGKTERLALVLPARRPAIVLTVRDRRGRGIEGAQVSAHAMDPDGLLRATVFTDGRGEARLSNASGLRVRVEARAPGYATRFVDVNGDAATVVLEVEEALEGIVRTRRGEPIAQAEITIATEDEVRRTRSDRAGIFRVRELAPGTVDIRVRATGFAPAETRVRVDDRGGRRATEATPIELVPEGIVHGVVTDGKGKPVALARVADGPVPAWVPGGAPPAGLATTDPSGRFVLRGLREGVRPIEALHPDEGSGRSDVQVIEGRTTDGVRIVLVRGGEKAPDVRTPGGVAITLGETGGDPREVVVASVVEGSEAERAGLRPGDAIVDVDGAKVDTMEGARARLGGPLALEVTLGVRRGERAMILRVRREPVRR